MGCGYGIRIEFTSPDDPPPGETVQTAPPAETTGQKTAKAVDTPEAPAPQSPSPDPPREAAAASEDLRTTRYQGWLSESNWLVRRLESGLTSPTLVRDGIQVVKNALMALHPHCQNNSVQQMLIEDTAREYQAISDRYHQQRRQTTADLLKLLQRKIVRHCQDA